jgi:hypothetical protein
MNSSRKSRENHIAGIIPSQAFSRSLGQERPNRLARAMSALPPITSQ